MEHLLAEQSTWVLWVVFGVSLALLVFGADKVVDAAVRLAKSAGLPKIIIGATVVSLGTTTPETAISVGAALAGAPGLALGNSVGSVIADTAFIFGFCCLLRPMAINRFVLNRHGWLQFGSGVLLSATCFGLWAVHGTMTRAVIPRWIGFVYLALLAGYLYLSVRWARNSGNQTEGDAEEKQGRLRLRQIVGTVALLAGGLALVVVSSKALIGAAESISRRSGVPESLLAVSLVALGTSLPEFATGIASIFKGHADLMVGNIVGADILNVLFVTGAAAAAAPLRVEPAFFTLYLPVMLVALGLFRVFILFGGARFRRWQGLVLLLLYAVFVALISQKV
jgi:cation:H+ antiporter